MHSAHCRYAGGCVNPGSHIPKARPVLVLVTATALGGLVVAETHSAEMALAVVVVLTIILAWVLAMVHRHGGPALAVPHHQDAIAPAPKRPALAGIYRRLAELEAQAAPALAGPAEIHAHLHLHGAEAATAAVAIAGQARGQLAPRPVLASLESRTEAYR